MPCAFEIDELTLDAEALCDIVRTIELLEEQLTALQEAVLDQQSGWEA